MCMPKAPSPPPAPVILPPATPSVSNATTKQNAPASADSSGRNVNVASSTARRRTTTESTYQLYGSCDHKERDEPYLLVFSFGQIQA